MDMDSTLRTDSLFNVDGLVAVITGGGTGWQSLVYTDLQEPTTLHVAAYNLS